MRLFPIAGFGFLLSAATAFSGTCAKDEILPRYFDSKLKTYSESNPIPDGLDADIVLLGMGCGGPIYLPDKREWSGAGIRYSIVKILPDKIKIRSKTLPIRRYLEESSFACVDSGSYIHCECIIRNVIVPRNPFWGNRINPDIEDTFVVDVCLPANRPGDLAAHFIRIERQIGAESDH